MNPSFDHWTWQAPAHWTRISTIDMHTGGEPLRVITSGLPPIEGRTVLEKRRYFREHYDHLRTGLMWEPRGHADMYGAIVTPSETADFDVFFLHNEGYSTMCGHAIIALTKLALESGLVRKPSDNPRLTINVPAGTIYAQAIMDADQVREVWFRNVPSFLYLREQECDVPGLGRVRFDVAYGGAFYAVVEAAPLGLQLTAQQYDRLIDYGRRIKQAVMMQFAIEHPFENELSFLYGTIFTGPAAAPEHHSRNVTIFAEGEVDRSATGSGVSARAALHHAKGELPLNEKIWVESILGTMMSVRAVEETKFGSYQAVIPEVGGTASYTGRHEFYFDPADPLGAGFIFR
ncbi:proline racemase family protein [Steroidobacter sp.]|uniref:proline racemase family protein n=1 Tax=Steroidobacter sp. TaxID=1978227 RepID=UPI001A3CF339|nr:proline racemase family protein [Steroidobacter sp.]MBL8271005.1 proline racemase family protein [Steroidobacter sp.]